MVNYLSKFSARLSDLAKPIRKLSKDKVPFNWGPEHWEAFNSVKKEIINASLLAYYNPRKEMILQTDTSIKGLGACLLQQGKPVYFASKVLTEAQKGYITIELECLAVAWAMEKFHHFLNNNHFMLETNQKLFIRSNAVKKLKSSYTMVTENSYQNIPISFHSASHSGTYWSIGRLSIQIKHSKCQYQATKITLLSANQPAKCKK